MKGKPPRVPDEMLELFSIPIILVIGLAVLYGAGKLMEFIIHVQS